MLVQHMLLPAYMMVLQKHGVSTSLVPFEVLWLHTVAHDHVCLARLVHSRRLLVAIGPWHKGGMLQHVFGYMFTRLFVEPVVNPLPWASSRIRDPARGRSLVVRLTPQAVAFWADLYAALSTIDASLAGEMTASIMY